jgi:4a-hydroxytetrahydrobiopterin dehydratase
MNDLTKKHCIPCEGGMPPLSNEKEDEMLKSIRQAQDPDGQVSGWILLRDGVHKITRLFKFKNFKESMTFVNKIAEIANKEDHHPDIKIVYNKVQLDLFTHAVGGLSENDFIMAAKINELNPKANS